MSTLRWSLIFTSLLSSLFVCNSFADEKKATLSAEDKKYLEDLMKEFLFDPKGAERVSVKTVVRSVWAHSDEVMVEGWLAGGKDGKPSRVYFTDGYSIPTPPEKEMKKIDFKAVCKARYAENPKKKEQKDDDDLDDRFRRMRQTAIGDLEINDLVLAAWLYRLGEEESAVTALHAARKGEGDLRKALRLELVWSGFAGMVHAYMVRADEEALAHGERLLRLYPDEIKEHREYRQIAEIVEGLKQRQKKGTFGKEPSKKWPDGFDKWDIKKKIAHLIESLEEVDARQDGQPGGVNFAGDRRVEALIQLGDAVVPDLIDVLEKDNRLTRSVHFKRDFIQNRTVHSVREASLTALMSILRTQFFVVNSTHDRFTIRSEDEVKEMVKRIRTYWQEYGKLPIDERMMKILTSPKSSFQYKREAAERLATIHQYLRLGTSSRITWPGLDRGPNPVIEKFSKPTVAEAILSAMDADLKALDEKLPKLGPEKHLREQLDIEQMYLSALRKLGDNRVASELAKRSTGSKLIHQRRLLATIAHHLDYPTAFQSFADDFRTGKMKFLDKNEDKEELEAILETLIRVGTLEANQALQALFDPKHPQYQIVTQKILSQKDQGFSGWSWYSHPFGFSILRKCLDDSSTTGKKYHIEENYLHHESPNSRGFSSIPEFLTDAKIRREKVDERVCDAAAMKLGELIIGLPDYHPLLKDADSGLTVFKKEFDRFSGNYRQATKHEIRFLHLDSRIPVYLPFYLPDIRPLDRAATVEDVKSGKAIFHLDGKGKPVDLKLPAIAIFKKDEKKEHPVPVLIVQGETNQEGQVAYGIILKNDIRAVPAQELTNIKTFTELDKEEKETAEKRQQQKE